MAKIYLSITFFCVMLFSVLFYLPTESKHEITPENYDFLGESKPLYPCPECAAKICYNLNLRLDTFFMRLYHFYSKYHFTEEALHCKYAVEMLKQNNQDKKCILLKNVCK